MHDFDLDPQGIRQPRITTTGEPVQAGDQTSASPVRAPRSVHGEASLLHLQRTIGNAGVVQMLADETAEDDRDASPVHDVVGRGGGTALDPGTRSAMESKFGQGFGDVRLHTDQRASASAESVGANAYTVGSDIVFRSGHFDPSSATGQRTIAHELTHVVQQRSGPVDGSDAPGGIRLSDPGDRFERAAEENADHVMSGDAPSPASLESAPSLQRQPDDAEESDDAVAPVQRESMEEDEDDEAAAT
jgi:hypothetical protein